jgi:hypothetical protein
VKECKATIAESVPPRFIIRDYHGSFTLHSCNPLKVVHKGIEKLAHWDLFDQRLRGIKAADDKDRAAINKRPIEDE